MEVDTTQPLTPKEIKHVQVIVSTLLYYAQAVDSTLLASLSTIPARQVNGTQAVAVHVINSLITLPLTPIPASATKRATWYCWYTQTPPTFPKLVEKAEQQDMFLSNCNDKDFINDAILMLLTIIKHVMLSASEAKLATLYYGCKLAAPLWTTLEELGHFQTSPTPVTTNNITAQGLTMRTMTPKASKSMDQHFHWVKCWNMQCLFQYLWHMAILNCANYSRKHHAPKHNQSVCHFLVFDNATVPKQWTHTSPHQSWQYSCYSVLTP